MSDATRTSKERDWRAGCECNRAGLCFRCQAAAEVERLNLQVAELEAGCTEFVRCQRELCALLGADGEGDSIALSERIKSGIHDLQQYHDWAEPQITHQASRPPGADWQPIDTAPKDGTPFVAWCVRRIDNSKDRRVDPVIARWRDPDGWIWTPPTRGGGQDHGTLTAWTRKPHSSFNCLHEADYLDKQNEVVVCDDCGVALEDVKAASGHLGDINGPGCDPDVP